MSLLDVPVGGCRQRLAQRPHNLRSVVSSPIPITTPITIPITTPITIPITTQTTQPQHLTKVGTLRRHGRLQHGLHRQPRPVRPPRAAVSASHGPQRRQQVLLLLGPSGTLKKLLLRLTRPRRTHKQQHAPATLLSVGHTRRGRHVTRPAENLGDFEQGEGGLGFAVGAGVAKRGLEEGEDERDAGARGGEDGNNRGFDLVLGWRERAACTEVTMSMLPEMRGGVM